MSDATHQIITYAAVAVAFGAVAVTSILKAEDPVRMVFKWILTLVILGFIRWEVFPSAARGGQATFSGICTAMFCGLALCFIWRQSIGSFFAKPFASLYDGGDVEPEPRPLYSIAQARQKQGHYLEAVAAIHKQLERFPTDFEGHMLLAQIQAENLKDMDAAELTIQRLVAQPGHAARNIAFALYSLADWHLEIGQDREAAGRALEQVGTLLPETEFALTAAHRIGHLGDAENPLVPHDKRYVVTEGPKNLGIRRGKTSIVPVEKDPAQMAAEYVKHLEQHPMDTEAREKLSIIYADHYARLDLATDQLEQLIQFPNQPARLVVRWLNQLADFQIRAGADYETVKHTLERIIELDPKLAAAETARRRIALLKLELKAKQNNDAVELGTYEQNIGLKRTGRPSGG